MGVQARFYVESITRRAYNRDNVEISLKAAGRGEENKTWSQYTPVGEMKMTVTNPEAAAWFEAHLGQDIALAFSERPYICERCHEEIQPVGEHSYVATGSTEGTYIHTPVCPRDREPVL